ncbi:MAG TPA: lysylphosphatidylglycerol synthase transmembrane domain-containing protein [Bryobacteraceae bacterium]|nr:lysylphosphatidylglycerol synthase transmembrane domain-containing protein [Bryobacteraceae bacterium]
MKPPIEDGKTNNKKTTHQLLLAFTWIISIGCLVWTLQGAELPKIGAELARTHPGWVAVAVVTDILVFCLHGWRWRLLLSPLSPVTFGQTVRAIYVGLFANEVLPFRTGEVIRCLLLARWTKLPFSVTLSSALVERIFDGLWLVLCLVLTALLVRLPKYVVDGAVILAVVVVLGAALVGAAMFNKANTKERFAGNRWLSKLNVLLEDLHIIGHSRFLYLSALASVPYLLIQIVPIYALAKAYPGLDISLAQAAAIMVILRLGSVVPQAPGNVGMFQFLTAVGLQLFGIAEPIAKRFSFVMWAVVTLPLLIAGFIALAITGLKMSQIQKEAATSMAEREAELARPNPHS